MDKKLNVLGVNIDNYYTSETAELINEYLNDECVNTIIVLHIPTLLKAADNDDFRQYIGQMDLTIAGSRAILEAAGIEDELSLREAEDKEFIVQFFRTVVKDKKTIYILGETAQAVDKYLKIITERHAGLNIAGKYAVDGYEEDCDTIVNEINSVSPDVILSILSSPFQEKFISENKNKLSAKVYFGLGSYTEDLDSGIKKSWITKRIDKRILMSRVKKYESGD